MSQVLKILVDFKRIILQKIGHLPLKHTTFW